MMPRPPALDTADASWARAIQPIGAWTIGCSTPRRSVTLVRMAAVSPLSALWSHPAALMTGSSAGTAKPRRSVSAASSARMWAGSAGGPVKWPCISAQPSARSSIACSFVSTPSATQARPRPFARPATAATIARSSAFIVTPWTNERSILIMSTENWRTKLSDENPVPKSSSASRTPSSFTSRRRAHAATVSRSNVPSVSSRHSSGGRSPPAAERAGDRLAKVRLGQLASAHVHRDLACRARGTRSSTPRPGGTPRAAPTCPRRR